jgi:hypothetical protein
MDKQSYISSVERYFQKGEYISIGKDSFKMLTSPKGFKNAEAKFFCFISALSPSEKLVEELCDYAKSVIFYDDPSFHDKILILPVFIGNGGGQVKKAYRKSGVYALPCYFNLEKNELSVADKFPLFTASAYKDFSRYAQRILKPKKTTEA